MIVLWILIGIVVLGLAGWAFWPGRRGVVDGDVRRARVLDKGKVENYHNYP
ncbi:hypothetical protein [Nocardioides sp. T2.26MG-1]|uniref:hypothetical protein n=1 Tax=Nocardioides sp. T2.26MG-1 TaxID=3041166 RepID=UPI00247795AE|nr:hypothetical protein [Nocardioides sp. T2.26MG-1]CAI9419838.1 hypothetical protein HIDPHFAB_03893 [Nocardioides sp. T2.26MG-1]